MLKCLRIKNFQSHKSSVVKFTPGLNVIVGTSDSGKSAILRAFVWVAYNTPTGGDFKSWFAKKEEETHVVAEFDDGVLGKHRKGDKNTYDIPGKKQPLEALRSDLPEEITNVTRLAEYNVQEQHEKYFLLQDSAGEVARKLNDLVGLNVIDRIFKNINRRVLEANRIIKDATEIQAGLKAQISELIYIDEAEAALLALESDFKRYMQHSFEADTLAGILESLHETKSELEDAQKLAALGPNMLALSSLTRCYEEKVNAWSALESEIEAATEREGELIIERDWLAVEEGYKALKTKYGQYTEQSNDRGLLDVALTRMCRQQAENTEAASAVTTLIVQYGALLQTEQVCPTCGSGINEETVDKIVQRLECY